jgi:uncharacterized protein (DUF2062 family)
MTLRHRLKRWLPTEETLRAHPSLRWLGPLLRRPWLWHLSRRRVAAGAAIGVFFGFLIPVMQIAAAAGVSVLLRANLPVAAAATLVSNPLTYVPIGVAAYQVGGWLLGEPVDEAGSKAQVEALAKELTREIEIPRAAEPGNPPVAAEPAKSPEDSPTPQVEPTPRWWQRLGHIGLPLMLGLAVFAVVGATATWVGVNLLWILLVRLRRSRGHGARSLQRADAPEDEAPDDEGPGRYGDRGGQRRE